jgi:anti-anti-sigma factor
VLVDLDAVTFLDCTGIGVLVAGYNTAAATGRGFRLIRPHGLVRDVLILTHLLPMLHAGQLGACTLGDDGDGRLGS